MSNNPVKYEVLIKQYLRSILDVRAYPIRTLQVRVYEVRNLNGTPDEKDKSSQFS